MPKALATVRWMPIATVRSETLKLLGQRVNRSALIEGMTIPTKSRISTQALRVAVVQRSQWH
jgi:hypothetical protein